METIDAQVFWSVIGRYNQDTVAVQLVLLVIVILALILSYTNKIPYFAKAILGIANLFIGIVFFGIYGTEPIQKFFALPLYIACGTLFLYEAWHNKDDRLNRINLFHIILLVLYCLYPFISIMLGNKFPQMVTYIMPCPIISLSIIVYAGYSRKNKMLLALLTVWGLTGFQSIIFSAYEDIILLICGIYGVYLLSKEIKSIKTVR